MQLRADYEHGSDSEDNSLGDGLRTNCSDRKDFDILMGRDRQSGIFTLDG